MKDPTPSTPAPATNATELMEQRDPNTATLAPELALSLEDTHDHHDDDGHHEPPSRTFQLANLLAIVLPFAGLIAAMVLLWDYGFGWTYLALLLSFYVLTALGITVGFHRLFTHKAFEAHRAVKAAFAVLGSMAIQGPLLQWVAEHRRHHQHSDRDGDPHSPHLHDGGFIDVLKGIFHAHMGWIIWPTKENYERYVPDLSKDRMIATLSRLFPLWAILSLALPALLGGLIDMSWKGALLGFLWGGLARLFLVHHVTWSVNSVCHLWGARPFRSRDESRNNVVVGVLAMGEGWHNTHHAFPTSARHGLSWWQLDISYLVIRLLSLMGLAWNVKVPAQATIEAKRNRPH